jgi:large subunit ribosomal protein L22
MADETVADVLQRPKEHRENRKKNRGRKVDDNQAQAVAKFIRVPPRKARLVIDEVRGRYALEALAFLRFIPNRAAGYISKALESAVANAANNHGLDPERLKLVEARVDEGPRMKRVQPRAQGRAYRILKRMSHITVIVQEVEPRPRKPRKPATRSRAQAAREARQPQVVAPAPVADVVPTVCPDETVTPVTAVHTEPAVAEVPKGPQEANTADKTDEIGAPTDAA